MSEPPDLDSLARRFLDLWQDQMTAMTADPEMAELMGRLMAMTAPGMAAFMPLAKGKGTGEGGPTDEDQREGDTTTLSKRGKRKTPPGAAAAPVPSGGDGLDLDELARRLADVESRLARLEAGAGAGAGGAEGKPRRRRS
jgi:hypothetical protein